MEFSPLAELSFGVGRPCVGGGVFLFVCLFVFFCLFCLLVWFFVLFFSLSFPAYKYQLFFAQYNTLCDWSGTRHKMMSCMNCTSHKLTTKVQLCSQMCPLFAMIGNTARSELSKALLVTSVSFWLLKAVVPFQCGLSR